MLSRLLACSTLVLSAACVGGPVAGNESAATVEDAIERHGFFDLKWDEASGRLFVRIDAFDSPFIYQTALARGVGSNDLGLDRGQLGATRIVRFVRSGPRVLLLQDNLDYRARTDDADERQAVAESFATSVLWGFDAANGKRGGVWIDATDFFLRDAHGLAAALSEDGEGTYAADASRSAIYMPRTKAFPDNTEIEAIVTYTGRPAGVHLPTVVPEPTSLTVHSHHSFVRLPDDDYEPLPYDPRAGVIGLSYGRRGFVDYASPIGGDRFVNFGRRHRLEKKNPEDERSEPVEPIVYYVDRGAPEPVRSALVDGASWWNEAFEAAGFKDAFEVRIMPEGADPMDVRYNVIQWVHRSTRGWSYGSSVLDPRTGEILKGHVTLGSLRVRQDYLIAEGLLAPYGGEAAPDTMLDMSLARIRQLSAHEVGHTIGFEHNFAASTQDRSSVMDYPFPLIRIDASGALDLSAAYAVGIGAWDKRAVMYAYSDFSPGVDRDAARAGIIEDTIAAGFKYVADADSRQVGTAHPDGNLWDNGADAIAELEHLLRVRADALGRFSESNIRIGRPAASIEEALVPIYLLHRYQLQAVGKLIGGLYYTYAMRGDGQPGPEPVEVTRQRQAIAALLGTLRPAVLRLPDGLAERIPPRPPGLPKSRETFSGATGVTFDPLAPAASAVALTLEVLLDPARAARMNRGRGPRFSELLRELLAASWFAEAPRAEPDASIQRQTEQLVLDALLRLAVNAAADDSVQAAALEAADGIYTRTESAPDKAAVRAHAALARRKIERMRADPDSVQALAPVIVPPGSPIGSDGPAFDGGRQ